MAIQKLEFYEGAALHQLIRGSNGVKVVHSPPLFVFDDHLQVHPEYSTGKRSRWSFTQMPDEQALFLRFTVEMRPKTVMLENVPALAKYSRFLLMRREG